MLLWFVGLSVVLVWVVFQSPTLDVRVVAAGALLPWLDGLTGGAWVLHTLAGSVALLTAVMLATRHRRLVRRRWLGIPIGTFLHLVLDGTWARTELFWWPFLGFDALGDGQVPEIEHLGVSLALELVGIALAVWIIRRFELVVPRRREEFVRTGRLGRDLLR